MLSLEARRWRPGGGRGGFNSVSASDLSLSPAEVAVTKASGVGKNSFDNRRGRRDGGEVVGRCGDVVGCFGGLGGPRTGRAESGGGGGGGAATGSTVGRMAE